MTNVLLNTSFFPKAIFVSFAAALSLALAACTDEEINTGIANLEGKPTPEQAALLTSEQQASVAASHPELVSSSSSSSEEVRYKVLPEIGSGPMGEYYATGPDCRPLFRERFCI